jgi:hypothetical protein
MTNQETVLSDDGYSMLALIVSGQIRIKDGLLQCQLVEEMRSFVKKDYETFSLLLDTEVVRCFDGDRIIATIKGKQEYLQELVRRQCAMEVV